MSFKNRLNRLERYTRPAPASPEPVRVICLRADRTAYVLPDGPELSAAEVKASGPLRTVKVLAGVTMDDL